MEAKRKGMLWGSFIGDALALGPHWVYNTNVIDKKFGRVSGYLDPLTSYHKGKQKGDFTHYGDQMMCLLESLTETNQFNPLQFSQAWLATMSDYRGYKDKATRTTLENMASGDLLASGSNSDDLGGASRIAPVIYAYAQDYDQAIKAAKHQTALTHNNPAVLDSSEFFTRLVLKIFSGQKPSDAIPALLDDQFKSTDMADAADMGLIGTDRDSREIITEFGQMCSVDTALPGTIHLIMKYETNFRGALVENVMAGGDSAARGMLVGMVLGAHLGIQSIPDEWLSDLNAYDKIVRLLQAIDGQDT